MKIYHSFHVHVINSDQGKSVINDFKYNFQQANKIFLRNSFPLYSCMADK